MSLIEAIVIACAAGYLLRLGWELTPFAKQPWLQTAPSQSLRQATRYFLQAAWGVITVQYGLYLWQLVDSGQPSVTRPDIVDSFLPIAGGLGLRAWLTQGITDLHHPAATISVLVVSLSALLLGRAFCSWICPLGLVGDWLHHLRSRLLPGDWTPPKTLDYFLRSQKFIVLGFLLFIILLAVPSTGLAYYLSSPYHQAADMKMGAFFFTLTPLAGLCLAWVVLLTAAVRQGFCRYLCPYGAWLSLLGRFTALRIRRNPQRCLRSRGHDCDKCARACPARIPVHQVLAVRQLECTNCLSCAQACPSRVNALHLATPTWRLRPIYLLAALAVVLFLLPLALHLGLDMWVSQTAPEMRRYLFSILPQLTH
ncbi:MAG: 4Fe-4S binding protein [Aeromonas sp.]